MIIHIEVCSYDLPGTPGAVNVFWMSALHWDRRGVAPAVWRKHCWKGKYLWPPSL